MGMCDPYGIALALGSLDQSFELAADELIVFEMIDEDVTFGKWDLKQLGRGPGYGFSGGSAVDIV